MTEFAGVFIEGHAQNKHADFFRKLGGNIIVAAQRHTKQRERVEMREQGVVKFWKDSYGFVKSDGGIDHFCHVKSLPAGLDRLLMGTRVSFLSQSGKSGKGPVASDISLV